MGGRVLLVSDRLDEGDGANGMAGNRPLLSPWHTLGTSNIQVPQAQPKAISSDFLDWVWCSGWSRSN